MTLRLLQEHGYDRLTVDAVAASARASKATVYRRWPSKAELVLAAFIEGIRQVAVPPNTGNLRDDLLRLGELICREVGQHASTIRAVLVEVSRNPALNDVLQHQFVDHRKALIQYILQQAVDRGEISSAAISDELWDLLPGYPRLPHLPVHHPQPAAHPGHGASPRRRRDTPQPHPIHRLSQRCEWLGTVVVSGPVPYC